MIIIISKKSIGENPQIQ